VLSVVTGVVLGVALAASSRWMLGFFNVSGAVRRDSLIILYFVSLIYFIRVFDIILIVGILRGGGDAKRALLIEGFTMWFVGVPLTILGAFLFKLPVYTVYALAVWEEVFKCIFGVLRLKSGRWIKNVTHDMG
jgi:Na+-driven multidrug efflux pump